MAEAKKRTTKTKVESTPAKPTKKEATKTTKKSTETTKRVTTVSRAKTTTRKKADTSTRDNGTVTRKTRTTVKKPKEDKSCKSCRFYVHLKKTVEGKEVKEPTCCFHWPMSDTKDMEKECSLYIKWEGSLHGCK